MSTTQPYRDYCRTMSRSNLWAEIRCRRVFPFLGIFIASGFLVLEGVDQLIGHAMLPDKAYLITLVFYAFGIPGTAIIAWFHGERGPQKPTLSEVWMQGFMLIGALGICFGVVKGDAARVPEAFAAPGKVIVVPLVDETGTGELDELVATVTDSITSMLERSVSAVVVSPEAVQSLFASDVPALDIARLLGADFVVSGTATLHGATGDWIRVTTQVARADDGVVIDGWEFESPRPLEP